MRIRLHAHRFFPNPEVSASIYRGWRGERLPTYRYAGACWMPLRSISWPDPKTWCRLLSARFGWHIDDLGRLYVYLGRICLWQDVIRMRPRLSYQDRYWWRYAHRLGPLEFVFG
jgi:hypothetical protein